MLQLKRQQVKAMLDIISKDITRPALENAKVVKYNDKLYLTGTDSYTLFMLEVKDESLLNRVIHRNEIERWYKLATGKDYLTEEVISDMQYTDATFPEVKDIVDRSLTGEQTDVIGFNADYTKKIQTLFGVGGLTLKLNGKLGAMVFESKDLTNAGYGLIMSLKVK